MPWCEMALAASVFRDLCRFHRILRAAWRGEPPNPYDPKISPSRRIELSTSPSRNVAVLKIGRGSRPRRDFRLLAGIKRLEDALATQALEFPISPIVNCRRVGERVRLLGNQHLPAAGDALDTRGLVDIGTAEIGSARDIISIDDRYPGVQADPD